LDTSLHSNAYGKGLCYFPVHNEKKFVALKKPLRGKRMFEKYWQIKTHGSRTRFAPVVGSWNEGNIVGET